MCGSSIVIHPVVALSPLLSLPSQDQCPWSEHGVATTRAEHTTHSANSGEQERGKEQWGKAPSCSPDPWLVECVGAFFLLLQSPPRLKMGVNMYSFFKKVSHAREIFQVDTWMISPRGTWIP